MKLKYIFLLYLSILCSCSEDIDTDCIPSRSYFSINRSDLETFSGLGGSQYVQIESENCIWSFTEVPDWISITPMSGNSSSEIQIQVKRNLGYRRRAEVIIEIQGDLSRNEFIIVDQDPYF